MYYIPFICIILFHSFFFAKSIWLSLKLKKSIRSSDLQTNLTIWGVVTTIAVFLWQYLQIQEYTPHWSTTMGYIFMISAVIIWAIALIHIKKSWRIGLPQWDQTQLITHGIYQFSRNPFFLAYDVLIIGMMIVTWSLFIILPWVITIGLFHYLIVREEVHLIKTHWETYQKYKEKVKRYRG